MNYLKDVGLTNEDVETIKYSVSDDIYSDLTLFAPLVKKNIEFLRDFGITNFKRVVIKYPDIFLRDEGSFENVFSKFDKDDLISKCLNNVAVIKKMVEFVDKN